MKSIKHLSQQEQEHYILCSHCKEYVDVRTLTTAVSHIHGFCIILKEISRLTTENNSVELHGDDILIHLN
jgi:hypothetical protein